MRSFILSAAFAVFATTAVADSNRAIVLPTPQASQGGSGDGAAVLLLLLGAVILMNGGLNGGDRAKTPSANVDTDDSVLMRF